jgi:hypothetical protein
MAFKMKKVIIAAMIAASCNIVHAEDNKQDYTWDKVDILKQVVVDTTLFIDYKQTLDIKNHHDLHETNVIIGAHPTDNQVKMYFTSVAIGQAVLAYTMPKDKRNMIENGVILLEIAVTKHNQSIGIHYKF